MRVDLHGLNPPELTIQPHWSLAEHAEQRQYKEAAAEFRRNTFQIETPGFSSIDTSCHQMQVRVAQVTQPDPQNSDPSLLRQSAVGAGWVLTLGFLVVVADFPMVCEVEPLNLFFRAGAQTDYGFHDES